MASSADSILQSAMNGEPLTVYADGSYLKDASGNIVGTLNDDGTYQLLTEFTPQQISEGQDTLLQSFENEVAASENQSILPQTVSAPEQTSLLKQSLFEKPTEKPFTNEAKLSENLSKKAPKVKSLTKPGESDSPKVTTSVPTKTKSVYSGMKKDTKIGSKLEPVKKPSPVRIKSNTTVGSGNSFQEKVTTGMQKPQISISKTNDVVTPNTPTIEKDTKVIGASAPSPLGSSSNPIRIIQQGNSYTSTQQLSQEQLAQIMQVVQQQQALKEAQEAGGSKVIYNPQTQTKIVYKVVNPSTGHAPVKSKSSSAVASLLTPKPRKRGRPKTPDEEEISGPELTPKEKEELKKKRPKTRSGRVSRPPKHMVTDYKHIHPLDWKEDYDDDDGGYSDYKPESDEEDEIEQNAKKIKLEEPEPKLEAPEQPVKNFKCPSCNKAYTQRRFLEAHFNQIPHHKPEGWKMPEVKKEEAVKENGESEQGKRAPWTKNSKRYRLKDMMSKCPDEVLLDVMLPKLCSMVTVWEFLLMKIEDDHPDTDVTFPMIFREFESLRLKVKQAFDENIKEKLLEKVDRDSDSSATSRQSDRFSYFTIKREDSAKALGTQTGLYRVVDKGSNKPDYMFLTSKMTPQVENQSNTSANRKVSMVTEDKIKVATKPKIEVRTSKSENKIEVLSLPKDKLPGSAPKKFKSMGQIKKELEMSRIKDSQAQSAALKKDIIVKSTANKPSEPKKIEIFRATGSKKIELKSLPHKSAAKAQEPSPSPSQITISAAAADKKPLVSRPPVSVAETVLSQKKEKVIQIPNTKPLTPSRVIKETTTESPKPSPLSDKPQKPLQLPVPARGSIVKTSTTKPVNKEDEKKKIAKALATSVENKKARDAHGVVSDMSDLDVWEPPGSKKSSAASASGKASTVLSRPGVPAGQSPAVISSSPSKAPRMVTLSQPSQNKMVSILGIKPEDRTVQLAPAAQHTQAAEAAFVQQQQHMSQAVPQQDPAVTAQPAESGVQSIVNESGEEMQIPEGVQMVIQHPDGSYQLIESPEEAQRLMAQAEMLEQQQQAAGEQHMMLEQPMEGIAQSVEQPMVSIAQSMEQPMVSIAQSMEQPMEGIAQSMEQAVSVTSEMVGQTTVSQIQFLEQPIDTTLQMTPQITQQPGTSVADQIPEVSTIGVSQISQLAQPNEALMQLANQAMEEQQALLQSQEGIGEIFEGDQPSVEQPPTEISQIPEQPPTEISQMPEQPSAEISQIPEQPSAEISQIPEQPSAEISQIPEQPGVSAAQGVPPQPGVAITTEEEAAETAFQMVDSWQKPQDSSQGVPQAEEPNTPLADQQGVLQAEESNVPLADQQGEPQAEESSAPLADQVNAEMAQMQQPVSEASQVAVSQEMAVSQEAPQQIFEQTTSETSQVMDQQPMFEQPSTEASQVMEQLTEGEQVASGHIEGAVAEPELLQQQADANAQLLLQQQAEAAQIMEQPAEPAQQIQQHTEFSQQEQTSVAAMNQMAQVADPAYADADIAQGGVHPAQVGQIADDSQLGQIASVDQSQAAAQIDQGAVNQSQAGTELIQAAGNQPEGEQAIDPNAQTLIFQTDDGLILIRQPDGNFQVQSTTGAPINMDTVRALINSLQIM